MGRFEGKFVGLVDGFNVGKHSLQPEQTADAHFISHVAGLEEQNDKQSHNKNR